MNKNDYEKPYMCDKSLIDSIFINVELMAAYQGLLPSTWCFLHLVHLSFNDVSTIVLRGIRSSHRSDVLIWVRNIWGELMEMRARNSFEWNCSRPSKTGWLGKYLRHLACS